MRIRVGVDVGGTFTDCVAVDERGRLVARRKEPSTPPDVQTGALSALGAVASEGDAPAHVVHGTTVATNALIQGRAGRVGLLTTAGFRDVLAIGTQQRPDLYDLMQRKADPLVPRALRLEADERVGPDGSVLRPLDEAAVRRAARRFARERVDAVAVCFLFAYADPAHERRAAEILRDELPGVDLALSSDVAPLWREYPRTSTTVVNAALRSVVSPYVRAFGRRAGAPVFVLGSDGGTLPADRAAEEPQRLLVSGPAGGVVGGAAYALARGEPDVVTMDMGGTSFDACLVLDGTPNVRPESSVAGHSVLASSIDLVTVGAGGGSVATVDAGGALVVGPASAGAVPGPACYGMGGTEPTVTDAALVVGRLDPDRFLGGRVGLDPDAARRAIADRVAGPLGIGVEPAAAAVLDVANATMARALRVVTVGRGRDPARMPLVAFGGAGPLAAASLAVETGAPSVIVPPLPGFVSAIGLLATDVRAEVARTVLRPGSGAVDAGELDRAVRSMSTEAGARLDAPDAAIALAVDCRYKGQGFELTVPLRATTPDALAEVRTAFHDAHEAVFGHSAADEPVEIVALRVTATAPGRSFAPTELDAAGRAASARATSVRKVFDGGVWVEAPVFDRDELPPGATIEGPAIVEEPESICWVPVGWRAEVDPFGSLVLRREGGVGRAIGSPRTEVLASALKGVALEMSEVLHRSAYSPVVREMLDFSCALLDADGRVVVQADDIPAQLGAMSRIVASIEASNPREEWRPGDAFLANHPYLGAAHTPDVFVFAPLFLDGRLAAWGGTCAHHVDLGGRNPGTEGADNESLFQEGLLLPSVRAMSEGRPVEDVWRIVEANVREPSSTLGDLRAQLAALATAGRRLEELAARLGAQVVLGAMHDVQDHAERRLRAELARLPDGAAEAEGSMDDDGAGGPPVRIHARVEVRDDTLVADLSGSDGQRRGGMNVPIVSTEATVSYAVRAALGGDLPVNDGFFRPISIVAPEGSVLNPRFPAAVSVRHLTCQRLADVLLTALGRLIPDRVVGGSFVGFFSIMAAGRSPMHGGTVVLQDILGGGGGGRPGIDGLDAVDTHVSNCALLPAEVCETLYPWRVERSELVAASGGDGASRGGLGIRRVYRALQSQPTVLYIDQTNPAFAPPGASGGEPGRQATIALRVRGRRRRLPTKATLEVPEGAEVIVETAGGGGWGPAETRDPESRRRDVRDGVARRARRQR